MDNINTKVPVKGYIYFVFFVAKVFSQKKWQNRVTFFAFVQHTKSLNIMKRYFLLCFFWGCFAHLSAQCPTSGNTVTVTTTASSGVGSLADAINCANTRPAVVNIAFNIPGPALKIIQPTSALPTLSKAGATIDGNLAGAHSRVHSQPAYI